MLRVLPPTIKPVLQQVISSNSSKTLFTRREGNPSARVNYEHLKNKKLCSVYDDNIFPFFMNLTFFFDRELMIISNLGPLQKMSRMTKHLSKACKV